MKNILVISYVGLMSTSSNGRTMKSLIQGFPKDNVSCFCSLGNTDKKVAKSTYKVSNTDALKSFITMREYGGVVDENVSVNPTDKEIKKSAKTPLKYLIREVVWRFGRWKGKNLKKWLLEQNADCVVYMYADSSSFQDFAVYVSKFLNIPLVVYSCEDYYFKDYNYINRNDKDVFCKLYQKMSRYSTKRLFKQADGLICNSDSLKERYTNTFDIKNSCTVMMTSNISFETIVSNSKNKDISYIGNISPARIGPLCEIANTLNDIDEDLKLHIYGKIVEEKSKELIKSHKNINYHGFVSYDEVKQIMYNSHLLIQAMDHDPYVLKDNKYAFSTKYADSFACGTPFFVYAPIELLETQFALEHNCAFVAETRDKLKDVLSEAIYNDKKRNEQVENAKKVKEMYFNSEKNISVFNNLIEEVTNSNK